VLTIWEMMQLLATGTESLDMLHLLSAHDLASSQEQENIGNTDCRDLLRCVLLYNKGLSEKTSQKNLNLKVKNEVFLPINC